MQIKARYIVLTFIVLLVAAFWAGWYSAGNLAAERVDELEERTKYFEAQLREYGSRITDLTDGLRWATKANYELTGAVQEIATENRRITGSIGNIGEGVSEDIDRVRSLEERIQYFIDKGSATGTE